MCWPGKGYNITQAEVDWILYVKFSIIAAFHPISQLDWFHFSKQDQVVKFDFRKNSLEVITLFRLTSGDILWLCYCIYYFQHFCCNKNIWGIRIAFRISSYWGLASLQSTASVLMSLLGDDYDNAVLRARLNKARLRLLDALEEQQEHITDSLTDRVFHV